MRLVFFVGRIWNITSNVKSIFLIEDQNKEGVYLSLCSKMTNATTAEDFEDLYHLATQKITFGEQLQNFIKENSNLEGLQKLGKKICQEIKFLKKVVKNGNLKYEHLQCSNLTHFDAIIRTLKSEQNIVSVNKVYMLEDRKITVDIVSNDGLKWTKVVARNPKSLSQIFMGKTGYGVKSIFDQAVDYVQCAQEYPCMFQIPKIEFTFVNGIGTNLAIKLEKLGISIKGDLLSICDIDNATESDLSDNEEINEQIAFQPNFIDPIDLSTQNISNIKKVNVDVSAMLAYCSNVANGSAFLYDFDVPVLKQQAEWERKNPVKPILDNFFNGKTLYCCETAKNSFLSIIETVGGPTEKIRSQCFLERVILLPDTFKDTPEEQHSDIFDSVQFTPDKELSLGGKIKQRSLRIFLFGDRIKAVTVTSNEGFVRAARQQNINFVVFIHESRALTEQKELLKAIPLCKKNIEKITDLNR